MKETIRKQLSDSKIPCEIYSRVCGFYRPVKQFNKGKREEYYNRKEYVINERQLEHLHK